MPCSSLTPHSETRTITERSHRVKGVSGFLFQLEGAHLLAQALELIEIDDVSDRHNTIFPRSLHRSGEY